MNSWRVPECSLPLTVWHTLLHHGYKQLTQQQQGVLGDRIGSQVRQMLGRLYPDDPRPHRPGSYQNLLQSTLLLLKLATLTSSIRVQTPNTQSTLLALGKTLRGLVNSMAEYACNKKKSGISNTSNMSGMTAVIQQEEDSMMSKLVVQLTVPEYCKAVTSRPATAATCCKMMTALMQASEEEATEVATEIVRRGDERV